MAFHFSANQFEKAYNSRRLCNWELPKWYPSRPRQRKGSTKVVSNKAGHLLPNVTKIDTNPWGNFLSTYQLPNKLTRRFGEDYNKCLLRRDRWKHFPQKTDSCGEKPHFCTSNCRDKCETIQTLLSAEKERKNELHLKHKPLDLEYVPGDFTLPAKQHDSRQFLLNQKYERDNNIEPDLPLDKLYLGDHECKLKSPQRDRYNNYTTPLPLTQSLTTALSPPLRDFQITDEKDTLDFDTKMPLNSITGKPNERCPSPIIPAYANFELAKRMHFDNLDHQPLADCVADLAYRKLQMTSRNNTPAGLALDIDPIATGVGIKTYNAGPTHCTKMKVFRPKTCGVVPKVYGNDGLRSASSAQPSKAMGAMDLAICWDYKPLGNVEPPRSKHIDGSNDSAGPAVFTHVKTPRDEPVLDRSATHSASVFSNTLGAGESGFFEKDIMRRKTDFSGRNIVTDDDCRCLDMPERVRSISRDFSARGAIGALPSRFGGKQYQSSPNISTLDYNALRDKYLGPAVSTCNITSTGPCKRDNPGFFQRARSRLCHKVAPAPTCCHGPTTERRNCRAAFRVGLPKYNAAGHFISSDSGCSSNGHGNVLVIPRQRNPYRKKNYDIDTLMPPFTTCKGAGAVGEYPEHWRLASVYQHAYKPMQQRRKPLIQTVFK